MKIILTTLISVTMLIGSGCTTIKEKIHDRTQPNNENIYHKGVKPDGKFGTKVVFEPVSLSTEASIAKFDADFRLSCADSVNTLVNTVSSVLPYSLPANANIAESAQIVRETMRGMSEFKRAENQIKVAQFHMVAIQACNAQPNAYAAKMHAQDGKTERSKARSSMMGSAFTSIASLATKLGLGALAFGAVTIASGGTIDYGPRSASADVGPEVAQ